ncbi:MAG TPA: hypothetical protein V6C89_10940 [Drouetiella sp.]
MLRNESVNSSALKTLGDQEIFVAVEALLQQDMLSTPLHRKVVDYIVQCKDIELISKLAVHVNSDVRCAVASNVNLPEELVWKLAEDNSFSVRASLADNHNLADFLLETLAEDEDERIAQRANRTLDKLSAAAAHAETISSKLCNWMLHLTAPVVRQHG